MITDAPWGTVQALAPERHEELRRRAIFDCCKWDPQVEDVSSVASFALTLKQLVFQELARLAEKLAQETTDLECALLDRPDLHGLLALPRPIRRALRQSKSSHGLPQRGRVIRFDFHPTMDGWRLSEANTDVPGGFNEASGLTKLMAEQLPNSVQAGDPAQQIAEFVSSQIAPGKTVALVHATAYVDDRQVMVYLARFLEKQGLHPILISPSHVRWIDSRAMIEADWFKGPADYLFRFFPAEWLPNLHRRSGWENWFASCRTPVSNPASALLTQSKRLPLIWDDLGVAVPAWRRLLPETCDPRDVEWKTNSGWVLKPALGRVGDMVGVAGATSQREWKQIRRALFWHPNHWVAQRKFASVPMPVDGEQWHVCLGIYTVDGKAAGIYGRASNQPLINHLARDVAVLIEKTSSSNRDTPAQRSRNQSLNHGSRRGGTDERPPRDYPRPSGGEGQGDKTSFQKYTIHRNRNKQRPNSSTYESIGAV